MVDYTLGSTGAEIDAAIAFADNGAAKAWVNYNQVTPAVNASYNNASVTDSASGVWKVNHTNVFADAFYASGYAATTYITVLWSTKMAAASCEFVTLNGGDIGVDTDGNNATFTGTLA